MGSCLSFIVAMFQANKLIEPQAANKRDGSGDNANI